MSEIEQVLRNLRLEIPSAPPPVANYVGVVCVGNLAFVSGHGPRSGDSYIYLGKVGADLTVHEGYQAARLAALNCLATLQAEFHDLGKVRRIVKVLGMVNSAPGFHDQPKVIDGASDLLSQVFGERGRHARSAVGAFELPMGIAVEIEMVVQVD